MSANDGQPGRSPPPDLSDDPTELPFGGGTATHAPALPADGSDPAAGAFVTTRKVSTKALRDLIRARDGAARPTSTLPPVSPEFLDKLRRIRRQSMDAEGIAFGKYTAFGLIGCGGMAQIRLAAETLPEGGIRLVVLKCLLPEHLKSDAHQALLLDEGRICLRLAHPNIVQLFDAGEIEGITYLAFELVDGLSVRDLTKLIDPGRLPVSCILDLGAQTAAGLAAAHAAKDADGRPLNVVHRDVTPHNILVDRQGQVKLADFGIARFADRQMQTQHGHLRGKLGYMAPEQCRPGPIEAPADVFALSLCLTELIAGRRILPPTLMVLQESEPLIRNACAESLEPVPDGLVELLVRMASVDPADRPHPTEDIARTLQTLVQVAEGPSLGEYGAKHLFNRLLPLDFPTMTDHPTRRVRSLGSAAIQPPGKMQEAYSSTMRRLRPITLSEVVPDLTPPTPTPTDLEEGVTAASSPAIAPSPGTVGPSQLAADLLSDAGPTRAPRTPVLEDDRLDVARTRRVETLTPRPEEAPVTEAIEVQTSVLPMIIGAVLTLAAIAAALFGLR